MYRIRAVAKLAGITSKALRHYELLGLLKPVRSSATMTTVSTPKIAAVTQVSSTSRPGSSLRKRAIMRMAVSLEFLFQRKRRCRPPFITTEPGTANRRSNCGAWGAATIPSSTVSRNGLFDRSSVEVVMASRRLVWTAGRSASESGFLNNPGGVNVDEEYRGHR